LDGGARGERSLIAFEPDEILTDAAQWPTWGRGDGWVLGYIGYGAGWVVEAVPSQAPTTEPDVWLGRYPGVLIYHHAPQAWELRGPPAWRERAAALLAEAAPEPPPPDVAATDERSVDARRYQQDVERILAWIGAGDCYQVNLSRAAHVAGVPNPWALYRRLRARSAPGLGAFLRLGPELAVLSNSPELLLSLRGDQLESDPIKGTRPRSQDPALDEAQAKELEVSPKERAELTMIVDLVRNDLGRVATAGSVRVEPRRITAHAAIHHAHQRVYATLAPGLDAWDALAATFPPGSVTGAPKVRACSRIAQLEHEPRGVYCGAIGVVEPSGDAAWSVAIRTAVWHDGDLRYHVGGGIVADSDPLAEWEETEHKAASLRAALGLIDARRDTNVVVSGSPPS